MCFSCRVVGQAAPARGQSQSPLNKRRTLGHTSQAWPLFIPRRSEYLTLEVSDPQNHRMPGFWRRPETSNTGCLDLVGDLLCPFLNFSWWSQSLSLSWLNSGVTYPTLRGTWPNDVAYAELPRDFVSGGVLPVQKLDIPGVWGCQG